MSTSPSAFTSIHSRRGQTLVEALIALSVLTAGFVGIVTLLSKSFQLNRTAGNDTQATYLASEGIEIAKNIIDYDVYYGFGQGGGTNPAAYDWQCSFQLGEGQTADYALAYDTVVSGCSAPPLVSAAGNKLYFDSTSDPTHGLYSYNNAYTRTNFTRDVYISVPAGSPNELDVQSTVKWSSGLSSNTVTLEDHFYNWHP